MVVYVPEGIEFETIRINAGAGKINIEELNTKELVLNLGAGNTEISRVNVSEKCSIDGGVGKLSILSGTINNLDLDMGIGQTFKEITKLCPNSNVTNGMNIVFTEDYSVKIN